jgi:hypothetical protein
MVLKGVQYIAIETGLARWPRPCEVEEYPADALFVMVSAHAMSVLSALFRRLFIPCACW